MRFPTHKTHLYNHGEYDSPLVKDDSVSRRQLLTTATTIQQNNPSDSDGKAATATLSVTATVVAVAVAIR